LATIHADAIDANGILTSPTGDIFDENNHMITSEPNKQKYINEKSSSRNDRPSSSIKRKNKFRKRNPRDQTLVKIEIKASRNDIRRQTYTKGVGHTIQGACMRGRAASTNEAGNVKLLLRPSRVHVLINSQNISLRRNARCNKSKSSSIRWPALVEDAEYDY